MRISRFNEGFSLRRHNHLGIDFVKRGNEVSSSSQTRFIVGVGHGGCGLADSSVFGTKSFNSYRLDSSSWIRLRVFDDSIHSMAFIHSINSSAASVHQPVVLSVFCPSPESPFSISSSNTHNSNRPRPRRCHHRPLLLPPCGVLPPSLGE